MSEPRRIVIVGGVAAGPKAAARARRLDPQADITIIEKSDIISYAGCGLPYYVSGVVEDRKALMASALGVVRDAAYFGQAKRVKVLTRTEAVAIDRKRKEVQVRDLATGETASIPYDKLVLATGADPVAPPIPGADLQNVLRLKRIEEADAFRAMIGTGACPQVVIIGGGLIGMEMAEAVTQCEKAVTVIEMLPQLMGMLDPDLSGLVEKRLREHGVTVMTSTRVERLEGDAEGKVSSVITSAGELPAQLVLLSIGIRPKVALARDAGLEIGPAGGIKVSQTMQTSDPDIYAAGDCTEKLNLLTGQTMLMPMGSVSNKEGRVAGTRVVGGEASFAGIVGTTVLKVFDWNVGRTGLSTAQAERLGLDFVSATVAGGDKPHYYPGSKPIVLRLLADRKTRRLLGVQGVGPGDVVKRIDVAATALTGGLTVDQVADLDLGYAPPFSEALDILINGANLLRNKLDGTVAGLPAMELKAMSDAGEDFVLVDVRTPGEFAAGRLAGAVHIPLGALGSRSGELPRDKRLVLYCKSSLRAYEAYRILTGQGFEGMKILEGGLLAWPYEVEAGG